MNEDIRFYCGIGDTSWNHHPVACGHYACVSPVYGRDDIKGPNRNKVYVPEQTQVIQDAGPFCDGPRHRLIHADAFQRQKDHARYYHYEQLITHRASYDLLIDETWKNEFRHKESWSEEAGKFAIKATVDAAAYLDAHREPNIGCVMSAQGVTLEQYLECAARVLTYCDPQHDIFGLGGWCILGKQTSLLKVFEPTMRELIPLVALFGVKRVHIWGVCFPPALAILLELCIRYNIKISTDSMGPSTHPVYGQWGYGSWRDNSYTKPPILESCMETTPGGYKAPSCTPGTRCRGLERARHVALTREWLGSFREREGHLFKDDKEPGYRQMKLEELEAAAC